MSVSVGKSPLPRSWPSIEIPQTMKILLPSNRNRHAQRPRRPSRWSRSATQRRLANHRGDRAGRGATGSRSPCGPGGSSSAWVRASCCSIRPILPIRTRTRLQDGFVALPPLAPKAAGTLNGLPVGPDRVLASMSGIEVEFVVAGGYESVPSSAARRHPGTPSGPASGRRIPPSQRRRVADSRVPPPLTAVWLGTTPGRRSRQTARGVRRAANADRRPDRTPRNPAGDPRIGRPRRVCASRPDAAGHSRVVQIAEDYALTHTAEPLYVTDLCEAAGVSERTLQYAFKEVMGMTPVAYLTRLRLHRVRQALRAATHRSTTVTPRRCAGASGTSAISLEPTRTASASCHRTPCDCLPMCANTRPANPHGGSPARGGRRSFAPGGRSSTV
jgi:hypothetical protein